MARPRRILRLQQLILEVVAETIQKEVRDPRIGLTSITRVRLAPDLTQAEVFWSSLAEGAALRTTARGLEDALPLIQRRVAGALYTRLTPRLTLRHDESLLRAARLETIFHQLASERTDGEEPTEDTAPPGGPASPGVPEQDQAPEEE